MIGATPTEFLELLWGGLHSLASDRGSFHTVGVYDIVDELLDAAQAENARGGNVWIGIHPLAHRVEKGRGGNDDVLEVRCLVADLDWHDPLQPLAHKATGLPTELELRQRLARFEHQPSITVDTGHGVQCYWILSSPAELRDGHELTSRLHAALDAAGLDAERDDLASVLRIPGTLSRKPGCDPVIVEIEELHAERIYTAQYLDKRLPAASRTGSGSGSGGVDSHGYDVVVAKLRADDRHQDADALELLCVRYNGHDPWITKNGHVEVTRPDKPAGASASIGFVGPGIVKMFSSAWEPFTKHCRYTVNADRTELVDQDDDLRFDAGSADGADSTPPSGERKRSARDIVIDLAVEHYTIGRTEDERPYLVATDGPNVALFSGAAKASLARRYRDTTRTSVGRTPLDEAWTTIEGIALDVPKTPLPLRAAVDPSGHLVIDIADVDGRTIVITPNGWTIEPRSPVTFRRSKAMLPLPDPVTGGDVDQLFELLRFAPASRDLFAAWCVSALFAELPHPAPVFRGEQGVAKSTAARLSSRLIDPCMADTQKPPKADDEWAQSCSARWVVAVDNVSTIPEWWSDALCRTITGDGWLRRALYTDDDVVVTRWRRCVILNGVTLGASLRPDLAERLVFFDLERPAEYLTEAEVLSRFDAIAPAVLGGLLDRAAAVLAALPNTEPVRDIRMADFAHLLAAHDNALGTASLDGYRRELDEAFDEALAGDPVAAAVLDLMHNRDEWVGTVTDLRKLLEPHRPAGDGFWPSSAHHLSQVMTRSAPSLRRAGITWHKPKRSGKERTRIARLARITDAADTADTDSLFVVFEGQKGGGEQTEGQTQQRGDPCPQRHSASASPRCPLCLTPGYDASTFVCPAQDCAGF